jgi:hypothetical protein
MSMYVVVGTSPFSETSVVCGPYKSPETCLLIGQELTHKGWVAETCELVSSRDVGVLHGAPADEEADNWVDETQDWPIEGR